MISSTLSAYIESQFGTIRSITCLKNGHCIVYKVETTATQFIVKTAGIEHKAQISAEKKGLQTLTLSGVIRCPKIMGSYQGALFTEYIPSKPHDQRSMSCLGRQLAKLHQIPQKYFGFESDNFIGNLAQKNTPEKNWIRFYTHNRLMPQLQMATKKGFLKGFYSAHTIERSLCQWIPDIQPSLLHGDLWLGNFLIHENATPYLIDPSVFFGHSEVDIAMSLLFGGFDASFYRAYHELIPKSKGFEERVELYQLYYLLVHLNIFGKNYYPSVQKLLEKYF